MMQIDKSPSYRKATSPEYDPDSACWMKILVMVFVALFGINGIKIAGQMSAYNNYIWVPVLLLSLSVTVAVINLVRLAKRYGKRSTM